jgi:hypothetical protein
LDLYIHSSIRLHGIVLNYLSIGTTLPCSFSFSASSPILHFLLFLFHLLFPPHLSPPLYIIPLLLHSVQDPEVPYRAQNSPPEHVRMHGDSTSNPVQLAHTLQIPGQPCHTLQSSVMRKLSQQRIVGLAMSCESDLYYPLTIYMRLPLPQLQIRGPLFFLYCSGMQENVNEVTLLRKSLHIYRQLTSA